jgi:hypothetical protein
MSKKDVAPIDSPYLYKKSIVYGITTKKEKEQPARKRNADENKRYLRIFLSVLYRAGKRKLITSFKIRGPEKIKLVIIETLISAKKA